ncbi:integration host factor, actinobacterial type [Rhodococcus triatomae]|nr:hypothetical protein G419_04915 [Rhodococcus triatomae BKS 15-14]
MAVPTLTPEQRAVALEKAAAARRARSQLREALKAGTTTVSDVVNGADADELLARTKVLYVIESLPGIGKVTAREILADLGVPETRRVGGLGARQRAELLSRLT